MFEIAAEAIDAAVAAGARYADARVIDGREQSIEVQNQAVESVAAGDSLGLGVRALVGSSWGFFAVQDLTAGTARQAGAEATAVARASALAAGPPLELAPVPAVEADYTTPHTEDPFAVSLTDKVDLLVECTRLMQAEQGVAIARASLNFWRTEKWYASSEGARIHQLLVESGGGMEAMALGEGETQRRSYPASAGDYRTGGYEVIRGFDFPGNAPRIAAEVVALLTAPQCPAGETDLILDGTQLALQIHESVGHATELDRILGWEAAFAGTSWLDVGKLGNLQFGSPLMNCTADATIPGALGTFGFDDEGTPAQRVDLTREGVLVGVLTGRDSAAVAGLPPGGMVRCDGYNRLPMVRMTNISILPGPHSFDEIVAETADGVYMSTNRSWSIDDKRLNFQFGCEVAWEVKDGKLGRMLRNPTYTGISPRFWGGLDMLASDPEWQPYGTPNCGKGQPMQVAHTGHGAAPARFRNVRVGVTG